MQARKDHGMTGRANPLNHKKRVAVDARPKKLSRTAAQPDVRDEVVTPGSPPPRARTSRPRTSAVKAQMDGWTTVGSEYLGRTVRRT